MNKLVNRTLIVVGLLSCVALAAAQTGGGGQGRRGGGFQRGGGGQSELQLAMRKDVQADIVVTDDQKTKLTALAEAGRGQNGGGANGRNGGGGQNGGGAAGSAQGQGQDREAMMKAMQERREKAHKDLAAILNETQMKRLGEISLQLQGNRAIMQADTQKALGLSDDQIAKIKDLQTKQQEAMTGLMEKMRNQEMTREELTDANKKNNETMNTELGKILTSDQAAKLKTMQGAPFKADPNETTGRRGGGGGGGGGF